MSSTTTYAPTPEQEQARVHFATGRSLKIEAGAGTGKTSTLRLLAVDAQAAGRRGQYVAFNKSLATEAGQTMPANVACSTAHSLAFRAVGKRYASRLNAPRMSSNEIARRLRVDPIYLTVGGVERKVLQAGYLAGVVLRAVGRFCQTADPVPTGAHFPYLEGIDLPNDAGRTFDNNRLVARTLLPALRAAWADLSSTTGSLPFRHDHYLKLWQLSGPRITADFILFDEAQDANPVLVAIIVAQAAYGTQLVWVGDSCQPPGTMVQVVVGRAQGSDYRSRRYVIEERPIEQLVQGDTVVTFDQAQSHIARAGRPVVGISARPFSGELVVAKVEGRLSRYTPDHRCIVKISDAFVGKHVVYMMRRAGQYRIGRARGVYGKSGFGPMLRAKAEGADALWVLSAHDTVEDAALAEATTAWLHNVPTVTFVAPWGSLSAERLAALWLKIGPNAQQAAAVAAAHGRDLRFPLWETGQGSLLVRRSLVVRACNLMDGMRLLPVGPEDRAVGKELGLRWWKPVAVAREHYVGPVYSMDVAEHHTYVADGIVTHNCQSIYAFTGAVNALATIPSDHTAWLTRSFRFGAEVASVANDVLGLLDADLRIEGVGPAGVVGEVADPDVILCRTNATAVAEVLSRQAAGERPALVGGAAEVVAFAKAAAALQAGEPTTHPELACFATWGEVQDYCVAPGTRVLCADMQWRAIDTLRVGDELLGFDEEAGPGTHGRRYRRAEIDSYALIERPCYRVWFDDGTAVVASAEHRWLAGYGSANLRWKQTERLAIGDRLATVGRPWEREESHDGGWLAGIYDGEGWLARSAKGSASVGVSQKPGPVLDRIERLLKERGFEFGRRDYSSASRLILAGGLSERMRLIGTLRPTRLLDRFVDSVDGLRVEARRTTRVVGIESLGVRPVVAMGTSTRTFIAEGLHSHNCDHDQLGSELRLLVRLVDKFGPDVILEALERLPREDAASIVVSTAHKSKGREWDSVRLAGDFPEPEEGEAPSPEELRLLYVSVTRARRELDVSSVGLLADLVAEAVPVTADEPAPAPEAVEAAPEPAPEPEPTAEPACPACGRTDVVRSSGIIGAHVCAAVRSEVTA